MIGEQVVFVNVFIVRDEYSKSALSKEILKHEMKLGQRSAGHPHQAGCCL